MKSLSFFLRRLSNLTSTRVCCNSEFPSPFQDDHDPKEEKGGVLASTTTTNAASGITQSTLSSTTGFHGPKTVHEDNQSLYFNLRRQESRPNGGGGGDGGRPGDKTIRGDDEGEGLVDNPLAVAEDALKSIDIDNEALMRTGKLFGGLILDIKRKCPWYLSDFRDAFHIQTIASIIYIYLATITKAITFGGFLGDITDGLQGVLESFLGHALAGGLFCLLGGQPLTVLGCTGPVLIFEKILVDFSV